ncbi:MULTISPECIES: response regulator [Pseudoalteromonas]|uniref:Response regulatory domain-containing protein n=1 Tax=Pseudoalteromonas aurantia 208 TaxID=1314867 RepID=A0ABR9EAT4_9GAMM|nr:MULTISPECIES: response regulator [Pseudoalteromonas]MBE0368086.1 hypothetical protein [Pseudoalteromonas aurantia 208]MBQ4847649.1 response regulator [Pseudoalteromonas sp. MMG005]
MIIDDESTDRYILKRVLKKSDKTGQIFEASNGQEALLFLAEHERGIKEFPDSFPPLIVFLDINMPIMGGFEFLEEFSKLRKNKTIYQTCFFAMFTSSDMQQDIERAESFEFVKGYISKATFTLEKYKAILAQLN